MERWQSVRVDLGDGALYSNQRVFRTEVIDNSYTIHPRFPTTNVEVGDRLITRYEELMENMQKQTEFYNNCVQPEIEKFLQQLSPSSLITVNGAESPGEIFKVRFQLNLR